MEYLQSVKQYGSKSDPDPGQNCLQSLSADDARRRVNVQFYWYDPWADPERFLEGFQLRQHFIFIIPAFFFRKNRI